MLNLINLINWSKCVSCHRDCKLIYKSSAWKPCSNIKEPVESIKEGWKDRSSLYPQLPKWNYLSPIDKLAFERYILASQSLLWSSLLPRVFRPLYLCRHHIRMYLYKGSNIKYNLLYLLLFHRAVRNQRYTSLILLLKRTKGPCAVNTPIVDFISRGFQLRISFVILFGSEI